MSAKDWATKRSARYDIRSYVCYAPQARSRGPGPHAVPVIPWPMKKRASLSKRIFWPKPRKPASGLCGPRPAKPVKNKLRPTVHAPTRLVKGRSWRRGRSRADSPIVCRGVFVSGFEALHRVRNGYLSKVSLPFSALLARTVLRPENRACESSVEDCLPRALGASTWRAVRKEERSLNARSVLAGCSATKPEHETSIPGEHAAGTQDEREASKRRERAPSAVGPKNSLRIVPSRAHRTRDDSPASGASRSALW
jgi:hypothetical protein